MKALITGASGFVGSYLEKLLLEKNYEVLGLSRNKSSLNGEYTDKYNCDILDVSRLSDIVTSYRPDQIFHLAAPAYIPNSLEEPRFTYNVIVGGTLNLLETIRASKNYPRLLYISSADVYGRTKIDSLAEDFPCKPNNPYSAAKASAELMCQQFYLTYDIQATIARPFNHTGPGQSLDFVCSNFAYQVALIKKVSNQAVIKTGNIHVKRDFLHVIDVVDAYMRLIDKGITGEIYNVCSGTPVEISQIIDWLFQIAEIENYKIELDRNKVRDNDIQLRVGNNKKIVEQTGWNQNYSLKSTVQNMYEYWRERI